MRALSFLILLVALTPRSEAGQCTESAARSAAQAYYQTVRTHLYIPEHALLTQFRPILSQSTFALLTKARRTEDAWVTAMKASRSDWWIDGTAIFFSQIDGYEKAVIDSVNTRTMTVQAALQGNLNGQTYSFTDRVAVVSENGHCVIHDAFFEHGDSMRAVIAEMIQEYEAEIRQVTK
jgi:hypothetical protein